MKYFSFSFLSACVSFLLLTSGVSPNKYKVVKPAIDVDSVKVAGVITSFVLWYKSSYFEIHKMPLTYTNNEGQYRVDTNATEIYLARLKSSGYISDNYIRDWRQYFASRALSFVENPQTEGPPEGFDFDLVVLTQEPELLWENIHSAKFSIIEETRNAAVVQVDGEWSHIFELSKTGEKWQIDYISIAEPD